MEHWNDALFLLLNAGQNASGSVVAGARFLADGLVWLVPAVLIIGWLRGSSATRQVLLAATLAGLSGLLINYLIGLLWYHPRPFAAGIGRTLIPHVADSSFPSDHLTLIWAISCSLVLNEQARLAGWVLAVLGLPVAWARIYLGVHFPLDILGAALVAMGSAWLILATRHRLVGPCMRLLLPAYGTVFAGLIRRGWVRQ